MLRVLWVLALVVVLGAVVASGMSHGWTTTHVGFGAALTVLAVVAVVPTKAKAAVGSRG